MISWERNRATLPAALTRFASGTGDAAVSSSPVGTAFPTSHGFGQQAASAKPSASAARMDDDRRLSFEQAHSKYHLKIYNLIYKWVGNQDDAEDLTAITFTNAWKAWGRFRGDAQVSTWLYQIAHNNYKNYCTQQARKRQYEGMSLDEGVDTGSGEGEIGREVADWSAVPEEVLLSSEFAALVRKYIEELSPEFRVVLVLAEQEEMSYEDIARITGLTVPNVKTRLHRARLRLRQRLEPYYRNWGRGENNNNGGDAKKPPKK